MVSERNLDRGHGLGQSSSFELIEGANRGSQELQSRVVEGGDEGLAGSESELAVKPSLHHHDKQLKNLK